jgi:hypothetical protein
LIKEVSRNSMSLPGSRREGYPPEASRRGVSRWGPLFQIVAALSLGAPYELLIDQKSQ